MIQFSRVGLCAAIVAMSIGTADKAVQTPNCRESDRALQLLKMPEEQNDRV
jgi:hypothetical protein